MRNKKMEEKIHNINIGLQEIEKARQFYYDNMFSDIYSKNEHRCWQTMAWLEQERNFLIDGWNDVDAFQRQLKTQISMDKKVKPLKIALEKIYYNAYTKGDE